MSQGHGSHPERAPTDQIWDNLSTKIIKENINHGGGGGGGIEIHEFILIIN